ncbi:MAG: bifunctional folylpolyglutamate synthase/dihydrofolate synthase [Candidatus Omnitrophica bacterium]|nr:bifunctional folylpolyglutamate synthase/dihydrofolate synthase [Candidatus Omnitrophota bacterium]
MNYPQAVSYLDELINYEKTPGYSYRDALNPARIHGFLAALGNPHHGLSVVHVAGSKGKGSTSICIASILRAGGYRVGLYTSPHLSDVRERIRVLSPEEPPVDYAGMITERELASLVAGIKGQVEAFNRSSSEGRLTFFEVYTALALLYFKRRAVDCAVLETGMGGRYDATNAVEAAVCVITPISLEHTEHLGSSLPEIAGEKAGIIKRREAPVVCAPQQDEVLSVVRRQCSSVSAQLITVDTRSFRGRVSLPGRHQRLNAAVAEEAALVFAGRTGLHLRRQEIERGLLEVRWPGRCELISLRPRVLIDGAHNSASARALSQTIREEFSYKRLVLVFGSMQDKDIEGMAGELAPLADEVILTRVEHPRCAAPETLTECFRPLPCRITHSVPDACVLALEGSMPGDLIVVCGSLYLAGAFREEYRKFRRKARRGGRAAGGSA